MRIVRTAVASDLDALQALYLHLNPERPELSRGRIATSSWQRPVAIWSPAACWG
jgi:hypothetical protein